MKDWKVVRSRWSTDGTRNERISVLDGESFRLLLKQTQGLGWHIEILASKLTLEKAVELKNKLTGESV